MVEPSLEALTTVLESARIVLAAAEVVERTALPLLEEVVKAKARTAGVSWRLAKQNIQRNMDRLRAAKKAENLCGDGIQFLFQSVTGRKIKLQNEMQIISIVFDVPGWYATTEWTTLFRRSSF